MPSATVASSSNQNSGSSSGGSVNANNNFRKFLFWLRYDGTRFAAMANNRASHHSRVGGISVYRLVELCLAQMLGCPGGGSEDDEKGGGIREAPRVLMTTVSRTDAKVHALRNPLLVYTPSASTAAQINGSTARFMGDFNALLGRVGFGQALEVLGIDPVAVGFHPNNHIAYRRYVYRLRRMRTRADFERANDRELMRGRTLADWAEAGYSWTLPPQFSPEVAERVCAQLRPPGLNLASFFQHQLGDRLRNQGYRNTTLRRQLRLLQMTKGEHYSVPDDSADFFNLEFVANGFMRQQIRRMVAVIVSCACGWTREEPERLVKFMLRDPEPRKFHEVGLEAAPPVGLFLADVVYDPRMYTNPVPVYMTSWDRQIQQETGQQLEANDCAINKEIVDLEDVNGEEEADEVE